MVDSERFKGVNFCLNCGNSLEIKHDKEGKERPQCTKCGWIYYKNAVPAVAVVVLNEKNEILLVKRKFPPQQDFWALPSGYMEIWQTPEETAVCELQEETGLIGDVDRFIGYYMGFSPIYEKVLSLGFKMNITGGCLQAGDDAEDARFFGERDLPVIAFWSHIDFMQKCGIKIQKETPDEIQ